MTRNYRLSIVGAVALAACAPPSTRPPPQDAHAARPAVELAPLAQFVVEQRAGAADVTITPYVAPAGATGRTVQPLLSGFTQTSAGSTAPPPEPPLGGVQLHQTAARGLDGACNTLATASGDAIPTPFQGVCFSIAVVSGLADREVARAYVEMSENPVGWPGNVGVVLHNLAPNDPELGALGTWGLYNHHVARAPAGPVNDRLAQRDLPTLRRVARNWYFQTPQPGASSSFRFLATVKGEPVYPIERRAPAVSGSECVPQGGTTYGRAVVSDGGRYVAFASSTAACRGGSGGPIQVLRHDRASGTTVLVSHAAGVPTGANGVHALPSISADGRFVAWRSTSTNLLPGTGDAFGYADPNAAADVYVRDLTTDAVYLASVDDATGASAGVAADHPALAPDGTYVVFDTTAQLDVGGADGNGFADVYRRDLFGQVTELVSPETGSRTSGAFVGATPAAVASNGVRVAFESDDGSFVAGDTGQRDVFVRDLGAGTTVRVSVSAAGAQPDADAANGTLSANGAVVAFESRATNLLGTTTTPGASHVYVRNADGGASLQRADGVGLAFATEANADARWPTLSSTGRFVAYTSEASNLSPLDTDNYPDVYLFDVRSPDARRRRPLLLSATRANIPGGSLAVLGGAALDASGNYAVLVSPAALVDGTVPPGNKLYVAPAR